MMIPSELLPLWLSGPAFPLLAAIFVWQLLGAPWQLLTINRLHHLLSLCVVLLAGLWWLRAGALPGLQFHLLGLTTMVLIFGWRLALVGGLAAMILTTALNGDWQAMAFNGLLGVVLPVFLANWLHGVIYRLMPRHLFVYLLAAAHFSSMLVIGAVIVTGGLLMVLLDVYPMGTVAREYLVFLPLVLIPEGFLNGAIMTTLILLRPEWVRSFDDRDYLIGK